MIRRGAVLLVLLVVCGLVAGSLAVAQPTMSGLSLSASVRSDGKVLLNWTKPAGDSVKFYLVYRSSLPVATSYTRIDSTTKNESLDSPASNVIPPVYMYYVEARMNRGSSMKSNIVTVMLNIPRVDVVRILSQPVTNGRVGVLYSYQVKAVSSDSTARLKYELSLRPTGMTIDSTGSIKWTPDRKGISTVQVSATSSKGGRASQLYFITVTGPSGTIAGTVTDSITGKPIAKVTVRLYGRNILTPFEYDAKTDSLGRYSISKIDFGTYSARAVPSNGNYLEQWYNGAVTADKATPIDVKDTVVVSVNFKLKSKATIPIFTVSGTVLDTLKKPIKDSWVSFAVSSFGFNSSRPVDSNWSGDDDDRDLFDQGQMKSFALGVSGAMPGVVSTMPGLDLNQSSDFRLDGNSIYVFTTKVDSTGKYSLKLPQGSYITQAYASGYYRLFYNNRSDLLSADIIKVQADVANINFVLKPILPVAYGKISGSVVDSTSHGGVISRVLAFRMRPVGKDTIIAPQSYMADTDSLGAYTIVNLPPGDYVVLAVPLGHYVPAFYSVLGSTWRWTDATKISVNGNIVAGITIYVVPMLKNATGYSSIRGNVTSSTPTSYGSMGKMSSAVGIEGSMVYAVDITSGEVAGYGITNTDGSFTVAELAPGSYSVTVDKVGYVTGASGTATANPTYDATTGAAIASTVSLNIDAVVTDVSQESGAVPDSYVLEQNYPNPFNPSTQILFSLPKTEKISLVVYNLLGQKVATLVDGLLEQGTHAVTWNGRDARGFQLSSGVYFYTLKTASFVASKKMIMLK